MSIWVGRLENGRWSAGVKVADGVQDATKRHPTWNPVLFQPRGGPLMLFYKVGPSPREWWGMVITSADDGRAWSPPSRLPEGILGPIKNKPVQLADGTIVSGSSTEAVDTDAWRVHVELTRDSDDVAAGRAARRRRVQRDSARHPAARGRTPAAALPEQGNARADQLVVRCRADMDTAGGIRAYAVNSGGDAVTLQDGRHVLVYNPRDKPGGAPANYRPDMLTGIKDAPSGPRARWPLVVSVSRDGVAWKEAVTLDDAPLRHGYAYPAVIQTRDGRVHVTYTFDRQKIKHVVIDPARL